MTVLTPEDRLDEEADCVRRIRRGESVDHYDTVRRCRDGSLIEISLSVSPVKNDQGQVIGAAEIARDITARRQSDAQTAILAREAEHRVKNILATVQATIRLTKADTTDGLKNAIEGRVRSLANVNSLFVESKWTGADLRSLITQELLPYCQDSDARARIDGPKIVLEPNAAQAMAVSVHELATNAAKYGALSVPNGHVEVKWSQTADGKLMIDWTESGGPPVKPPTHQGVGTRVIDGMIRGQLSGAVHFDWRAEGLACSIVLDVSDAP